MIEEQALVIDREGDYVWVQTQRQTSCGHCSVQKGCGTSILSRMLGNKTAHVRCLNSGNAKIGDRVLIGIEESALLSGSLLVYFLPLINMIIFAAISVFLAKTWWPEAIDLLSIIASVLGLFLGLLMANHLTQNSNLRKRYEPVIISNLDNNNTVNIKPVVWNKQ